MSVSISPRRTRGKRRSSVPDACPRIGSIGRGLAATPPQSPLPPLIRPFPKAITDFSDVEEPTSARTATASPLRSSFSNNSSRRNNKQVGAILVDMAYQRVSEELHVTIVRGRNLPAVTSAADGLDAFVCVSLMSDGSKSGRHRTRTTKRSLDPEWNEAVFHWDAWESNTLVGETYISLAPTLDACSDGIESWFVLQPSHMLVGRSGSRWLRSSRTAQDMQQTTNTAPLISWLNEQTQLQSPDASLEERERLASYKNKRWTDCVPQTACLEGRARKEAEAVWELLASEAAHYQVLTTLKDPFQRYLDKLQTSDATDPRISRAMSDVDSRRLFGNLHDLLVVSEAFLRDLERVLVVKPAEALTTATEDSPDVVASAVLDLEGILNAFTAMQAALLGPELQYRLHHIKARAYLKYQLDHGDGHFATFVRWCEEDERCGRLTLVDLLTQPLQRLTRYPLLLKAISKEARARAVQPPETLEKLDSLLQRLSQAIEQHDREVHRIEGQAKLERITLRLVWPSAAMYAADAYVPPEHRALLGAPSVVSLATQYHHLDGDNTVREFVHEGWLTLVNRSGNDGESIMMFLVGALIVLAKPLGMEPQRPHNGPSGTSRRLSGGSDVVQDSNPTDDDDDKAPPMQVVAGPIHLAEAKVFDVADGRQGCNCFLLLQLNGFNQPAHYYVFRADSAYEKQTWLKCMREVTDRLNGVFKSSSASTPTSPSPIVKAGHGSSVSEELFAVQQPPSPDWLPRGLKRANDSSSSLGGDAPPNLVDVESKASAVSLNATLPNPGYGSMSSLFTASSGAEPKPGSSLRNSNGRRNTTGARTRTMAARWSTHSVSHRESQADRVLMVSNLRRCSEALTGSNTSLSSGDVSVTPVPSPLKRHSQSPITVDTTSEVLRGLQSPDSVRGCSTGVDAIVYNDGASRAGTAESLAYWVKGEDGRTESGGNSPEGSSSNLVVTTNPAILNPAHSGPSAGPMRVPVQRTASPGRNIDAIFEDEESSGSNRKPARRVSDAKNILELVGRYRQRLASLSRSPSPGPSPGSGQEHAAASRRGRSVSDGPMHRAAAASAVLAAAAAVTAAAESGGIDSVVSLSNMATRPSQILRTPSGGTLV